MKLILIVLALVFAFTTSVSAQSGVKKENKMPPVKCRTQQTSTIPLGQCTMTKDMMQTITDILVIHKKIIKASSQAEKQQLLRDMTAMREKIISINKEKGNMCFTHLMQSQKQL